MSSGESSVENVGTIESAHFIARISILKSLVSIENFESLMALEQETNKKVKIFPYLVTVLTLSLFDFSENKSTNALMLIAVGSLISRD